MPDGTHSTVGPTLGRRTLMKVAGLGALTAALGTACSSSDRTKIRMVETKPEIIPYVNKLCDTFNRSQQKISVTHDATSSLIADFVRGDPPDIDWDNYNLTTSIFVARGVLADLAALPEAKTIDPGIQALVSQYAQYHGETSVLPYSVTAAGVIYNKDLFAKAGVDVPTTWTELLAVCAKFKSMSITPIFATVKEGWTIQQGLFDYVSGGMFDIAGFYKKLNAQGADIGKGSGVSFETDFAPATDKMVQLAQYFQPDAASRSYGDGNVAFARGDAAMLLQGPWAIGEIATINPATKVGCFPLPATDSAADTKARVNLDLAIWIPRSASGAKRDAAMTLLTYLMQPSLMSSYNQTNLAFSPRNDDTSTPDERIAGLKTYIDDGRFYQGAGTYVPNVIPIGNYLQDMVISKNPKTVLSKLDSDYRRLATRTAA